MTIQRLPPAYLNPLPSRALARKDADKTGAAGEPAVTGQSRNAEPPAVELLRARARLKLRGEAAVLARALKSITDGEERTRLKRRFLRSVLAAELPHSSARHGDLAGLVGELESALEGDPALSEQFKRALAAVQ